MSLAVATAAFVVGGAVQVTLLTWRHWKKKHAVLLIALPIIWALGVGELGNVWRATLVFFVGTLLALSTIFRQAIVPRITALSLLAGTLALWALLLEMDWNSILTLVFAGLLIAPSLAAAALTLRNQRPGRSVCIAATTYAIVQIAFIAGIEFRLGDLDFLYHATTPPAILHAFVTGLLFAFLLAHLGQIVAIIRPPSDRSPAGQRRARREHLDFLATRFQATQPSPRAAITRVAIFLAYWSLGRTVLQLEATILLWPWLVAAALASHILIAKQRPQPTAGAPD